jgi:hypothetical protein
MKEPTFHLVDDPATEASGADIVVCYRVAELPIPSVPGKIVICTQCAERIWLADSSPQQSKRLCWQCAGPLMEADDDLHIMMTRRQAREIAKWKKENPG